MKGRQIIILTWYLTNDKNVLQDSDRMDLMYKCGRQGNGDINGFRQMMRKFGAKAVINATWPGGTWKCLHHAANFGHIDIITLLVENGADLDPKALSDETPLRMAIKRRKYASITTLIKLGASLEKAKESDYEQSEFDARMRDVNTKLAIAGQRKKD